MVNGAACLEICRLLIHKQTTSDVWLPLKRTWISDLRWRILEFKQNTVGLRQRSTSAGDQGSNIYGTKLEFMTSIQTGRSNLH